MKTKEEQQQYYLDNKDKIKEYSDKYREKNREKILAYKKKYREKNKEKISAYKKKYCAENKDKINQYNKKKNRNCNILNHDEYQLKFTEQKGKCSICGCHQDELKRNLAVDHDHETGKIRDLLCAKCNSLIGFANDNINILESAIDYLKKHKS